MDTRKKGWMLLCEKVEMQHGNEENTAMDMKAYYIEADNNLITSLQRSSEEDRMDQIELIQDLHKYRYYAMGKWWDALHFLLTGVTACEPVEYSMLSEAVVGKKLFCEDENANYIAYTSAEELAKISAAMEWLKVKEVMGAFSLEELIKHDIYPAGWREDKIDEYKKELANAFKTLRRFYQLMVESGKGTVVCIY